MRSRVVDEWSPRSAPERLTPGSLHLWTIDLDSLGGHAAELATLLSPDERARAERFHFERDAARYVVGRGVLRRLLGGYGAGDARALTLIYGPHGKPALSGEPIRFNLAHTGGLAVLAVSADADVGVDVEHAHPFPDLASVMRSCFAEGERERIERLDTESERFEAFYRCWTRKEAVLKALGSGLARPLDSFEVSVDEGPRLLSMSDADDTRMWQMVHFDHDGGYIGAVAWQGAPQTIARFAYEP